MGRFEPFSDFELKEIWYVLTRDECGWPIVFAKDDKLRPLVEEMYAEAERRGIPAGVDETGPYSLTVTCPGAPT
jgi:hypothetical protein